MYKVICLTGAKKDLKRLPKQVRGKIEEIFLFLADNPLLGKHLQGELSQYFSYHLKVHPVEYRIIYQIFEHKITVAIVLVGTRENIYKELKQRIS